MAVMVQEMYHNVAYLREHISMPQEWKLPLY